MSLINFANGMSEMGKNVAAFAGEAGLTQQKADLQMQAAQLADSLATTRETTMENLRSTHEGERQDKSNTAAMERLDVTEKGQDRRQGEQHKNTLEEISARSKAQISAAAAEHGLSANDMSWIETDDEGKKYGVTRTGKKIDLGITGPNAADEKILAHAEKFAQSKKTVVDPDTGQKTTEEVIDPQKAADFLERQGRKDLAAGYAKPPKAVAPPIPTGLPAGSQWSPSRKQWRDPDGKIYDDGGKPVGAKPASLLNGLGSASPAP